VPSMITLFAMCAPLSMVVILAFISLIHLKINMLSTVCAAFTIPDVINACIGHSHVPP
jgi:hypothetical protein